MEGEEFDLRHSGEVESRERTDSKGDDVEKPKLEFKSSFKSIKEKVPAKKLVADTLLSNMSTIEHRYQTEETPDQKLSRILANRDLCLIFRTFLKEQKCEENLSFWIEVELFKRECDPNEMKQKAETIYQKYFTEGVLNIDCEVKQELRTSLDNTVTSESFDGVQKQISRLMETSSLQKFLLTEDWLKHEGA
jgi:hypothetical protein